MKVMPVKPPDKGLLLSSHVDFTIPSPFAQEHLYYLIQYGRYQCVPGYEVERDFLDMYCVRMYAAVHCTPSAENRARTLPPDSLYSWTAAFPTGITSPSRPSSSGFTFPAAKARLMSGC